MVLAPAELRPHYDDFLNRPDLLTALTPSSPNVAREGLLRAC